MTAVEVLPPSDTFRQRERNAARTPEVLPPDVESKVSALRRLDGAAQVAQVTVMLSHARTGLLAAIAAHDLPQIVEYKQKAAAIQEIAKQVRMGKEFQLDAAEFVRRAERGLGIAIREAQDRGEVRARNDGPRGMHVAGVRGSLPNSTVEVDDGRSSPAEYLGNGGQAQHETYAMTDNVTDEVFEQVLAEAREEGNLTRRNVARKARAKAQPKDPATKPTPIRKTAAARKVMEDLVVTINSLAFVVKDTDPQEVDYQAHQQDVEDIWEATNIIRKFLKLIKEGD